MELTVKKGKDSQTLPGSRNGNDSYKSMNRTFVPQVNVKAQTYIQDTLNRMKLYIVMAFFWFSLQVT